MKEKRVCGTPLLAAIAAALVVLTLPTWAAARPQVGDKLPDTVMQQVPAEWQSGDFVAVVYDYSRQQAPIGARPKSWDESYYPVLLLCYYETKQQLASVRDSMAEIAYGATNRFRVVYTDEATLKMKYGWPQKLFVHGGIVALMGLKDIPRESVSNSAFGQLAFDIELPQQIPSEQAPMPQGPDRRPVMVRVTAQPITVKVTVIRPAGSGAAPISYRVRASSLPLLIRSDKPPKPVTIGEGDKWTGNEAALTVTVPPKTFVLEIVLDYEIGGVPLRYMDRIRILR